MAGVIITILTIILASLFGVLYCLQPLRSFLTANNLGALVNVYSALDEFFLKAWNASFGHFVTLGGDESSQLTIKAIVIIVTITIVFLLIVVGTISILKKIHSSKKIRHNKLIKQEKDNLSQIGNTPLVNNQFNSNDINFRNNKVPYVDSVNLPNYSTNQTEIIKPVKKPPVIRIILSVLIGLISLVYLFFRLIYISDITLLNNAFSNIVNNDLFIKVNKKITDINYFIFKPFYFNKIGNIGATDFYLGYICELICLVLITLLLILLVVFIGKKINKSIQLKKFNKQVNQLKSNQLSSKALGILGDFDNEELNKGDISLIAISSPSLKYQQSQKSIISKGEYIDDIGYGVEYIGKAEKEEGYIPPSPTRRSYVLEPLSEDLTNNNGITLDDILSIDESNNEVNNIKVSYMNQVDETEEMNLNGINIEDIAKINKAENDQMITKNNVDDIISFDEDGDAYLIKQGKLFDSKEDIPPLFDPYNASKTLLINKLGVKNYQLLDKIEPFKLVPLDILTEINEAKNRMNKENIASNIDIINQSLIKKPFEVINGSETDGK